MLVNNFRFRSRFPCHALDLYILFLLPFCKKDSPYIIELTMFSIKTTVLQGVLRLPAALFGVKSFMKYSCCSCDSVHIFKQHLQRCCNIILCSSLLPYVTFTSCSYIAVVVVGCKALQGKGCDRILHRDALQ